MKLLLALGLVIIAVISTAQDAMSKVIAIPQANVFCQLDRNIYLPGDTIRFAGYILSHKQSIVDEQNILYILLIDPIERKLVKKNRWAIEGGLSHGFLAIPDTLEGGYYWFMAFTNYMTQYYGNQPVFRQLIRVGTPLYDAFRIIMDTVEEKRDSIYIHYKVGTRYKGLAAGGSIKYTIWQMADSLTSGTTAIDPFGEAMIPISRNRINMHYGIYEAIQITMVVSRAGERTRMIRPVKWQPKQGIPKE